ncbi:MAG: ionic transporter y4hA [Thermoleophilia bacterium]
MLALLALAAAWGRDLPVIAVVVIGAVLAVAVIAAVHHAEVVAHRVGEPYGSIVLAVAVTVIEVGLIVALMISGGEEANALARDTVFAAVMITCNGIVGLALLVGAVKYGLTHFNAEGAGSALATVATLAATCLVLPAYTTSADGPVFSTAQLVFAAVASLALYGLFVATQAGKHRDFFLPVTSQGDILEEDEHADPPSARAAWTSLGLLVASLVAVVGLAKVVSPSVESAVADAGLPNAFVGVIIALLILAPETLAATRAALRDRMQTSLNLAFGSAMASIGLTIPAIAVASRWIEGDLVLGLGDTQITLLVLTMFVSALTVIPGRATRLQGGVHLVLLAAFVFLAMNP